METDALRTLKESLALNVALKERYDRLGDFARRVEQLRTAKLMNDGQIVALKEQLERLQGRLIEPKSNQTIKRILNRPMQPKNSPRVQIVLAQPKKVSSEWNHLANLMERASGKVSVVGRKRNEVLAHLEAHFGKERAMELSSRFQVLQKVPRTSKRGVIVFPKAGQDPQSVQRLIQQRRFDHPAAILHNGRVLQVQ